MSKLTRRNFFALLGGAAAATAVLASCTNNALPPLADARPDTPSSPGCSTSDAATTIADNHSHAPHKLIVPSADVQTATADMTYDIMGMANHTHSVTVTVAQFATLKAGGTVMSTSTATDILGTPHMHVCTISCA